MMIAGSGLRACLNLYNQSWCRDNRRFRRGKEVRAFCKVADCIEELCILLFLWRLVGGRKVPVFIASATFTSRLQGIRTQRLAKSLDLAMGVGQQY